MLPEREPDFRFRPPTLADSFRMEGEFWALGNARLKVAGAVRYAPAEGIHLDLVASLWNHRNPFHRMFDGREANTIHGMLAGSVPVSLHRCIDTGPNYYANIALFGRHYQSLSRVRFRTFDLRVENLEQWVASQPWGSERSDVDGRVRWSISHTDPDTVTIRIPASRLRIEIESSLQLNSEIGGFHSLQHTDTIRVLPDRPITWKTFRRQLATLQQLLVLLAGAPLRTRRVEGVPLGHRETDLPHPVVWVFFKEVELKDVGSIHPAEMLFTVPALGAQLEPVFRSWFSQAERLKGIYQVFFGTFGTPPPFLETRFFHLAQCLESFHRKAIARGRGKYLPPKRWKRTLKRVRAAIPKRLPADIADAVSRSIAWANDFSFPDRLKALFALLEPETAALITDDPDRFREAIKDTRNWFTHLERRPKSKAFPQRNWLHACKTMELFLLILILKNVGISEDRIRDRLANCGRFRMSPYTFNGPQADGDDGDEDED